ncbi:MAG: enolase C-terminal domain-like protein [Gammaproteobacteria bacterium]|nr:enolase C-terminal domain-like protein [Gammaproteobacteria bacterium]
MTTEPLVIRALRARAVNVPMKRPLVTGGGAVAVAPLVLIDLETDRGVTGSAYVFAYTSLALAPLARLVENLGGVLEGQPLAPAVIAEMLGGTFRLIGLQGLTAMAAGGIDMAAWDALSKAAGLPLVRMLGGEPRPVRAYNSKGLGLIGADAAGKEAAELQAEGFTAVKVRLGYADVRDDLAVVRAVRAAIGDDAPLMSDYNQCLSAAEAEQRIRVLDDEGLYWVEEPVRFDDFAGHARIRGNVHTPVQTGENCWGVSDMAKALEAGACDYFMADAVKIGGVSGWLEAAALAAACGVPLSSHLFPEVSVHLLGVTRTRHWLEYVDWAEPVLEEPVTIRDGHALVPERPGIGLQWNEEAVARYAA